MNDGGKGSKPRPLSVSNEEYAARWDAIFGRSIGSQSANSECPRCESDDVEVLTRPVHGIETTYKECMGCGLVWGME